MQKGFLAVLLLFSISSLALTQDSSVQSTIPNIDSGIFILPHRILEEEPTVETTTEQTQTPATEHHEEEEHETKLTPDDPEFYMCLGMALFLVCFAGAMSGLTVGYLSIDELQLELKMKNGTDQEKADAMIIMPILAKHHLLLSTLLLANAFAMEALPIFLDAVMPAFLAVIISTSAVVIFGEIVPQAYCTGPDQIKIARGMAPLIKVLMLFFYPICYPISLALDHILGTHQKTRFVKKDLKALIELHKIERSSPKSGNFGDHHGGHEIKADAQLTVDEIKLINSTIDLRETPVTKEMEKIEKVFMINNAAKLDDDMIKRICKSGFSKIPVYRKDKNNVIGFLRAKILLDVDKFRGKSIEESGIFLNEPLIVAKDTSMLEMLMLFQENKTSIALVSEESVKDKGGNAFLYSKRNPDTDDKPRLVGLVSLKDIFEELLESKMADDDIHGPVTLHSGNQTNKFNKRFAGSKLPEIGEASERPEKGTKGKGLSKPLLEP